MLKSKTAILSAALALALSSSFVSNARTDDAETSLKNAVSDVNTTASKMVRHSKKTFRKATGQDTAAKDAQDSVGDAKDDAKNSATKAKNELSQ